ncbi:MAG: hypothetical protein E6931_11580 [Clostridium botulinum]|nr:hypothetical protein [Clostridium botulinum]
MLNWIIHKKKLVFECFAIQGVNSSVGVAEMGKEIKKVKKVV